jgi:hypothetical protein
VRAHPWLLLLSLLLSVPAAAQARAEGLSPRKRTLVAPERPGEVPALVLHVAAGVATLVQLEAPLRLGALRLPEGAQPLRLVPMGSDTLVVVPSEGMAEGTQVSLSVEAEPGAQPLRFLLIARRGQVDLQVRVVRGQDSTEEAGAESVARSLLAASDARATLAVPQRLIERPLQGAHAQLTSVLWMGRRLFATASVRSRKKATSPGRLVQVRLRATLGDESVLEWPARLLSGEAERSRQLHVLTGLLPEGASGLEVALDGEDSPGKFEPVPLEEGGPPP